MLQTQRLTYPLLGLFLAASATAVSEERDRAKIADVYKWDLKALYAGPEAWRAAKEKLQGRLPAADAFQGTLGQSPARLKGALDLAFDLNKEMARLYSYAAMLSDQDTRDSKALGMKQEAAQLATDLSARTAYVDPEILKLGKSTVASFLAQEKGLAVYRQYLDDLLRRQAHTLTEGEEKLLADAGLITGGAYEVYNVLANADFPHPEVTLEGGKKVKLDASSFALQRTSANREDRKKVFSAFFGKLDEFRRTFGATLASNVKRDMFLARARKYDSSLESALDPSNIPVAVYKGLVDNVDRSLGTFHRYLALRKRMLGVPELHYYDLYAPLVSGVDLKYSVEEGQQIVLEAFAPLGKDYQGVVKRAFGERWLDFLPNEGKRSGAYSNGSSYDVHPFMLLNYNGKYDDVSTLAHELGHTMQSYLSNKAQPYPTAGYPIFVAEVASTFNEALLMDRMLKTVKDDSVRLSLLGNYLEGIKGTVFRQTQFAEFELAIHERAEKGEALTGDSLNALYLQIARKYYGHDKGVCIVDDEVKAEWAFIPHMYYNFYVYQYATSFTASAALSEQVMGGDKAALDRYLTFLSAGGSDYPIELLKKAGVDMTTSAPFELTMKKMNRVMDEMEKLLAKRG